MAASELKAAFNASAAAVETNAPATARTSRDQEPNPARGLRLLTSAGLAISAILILLVGIVLLRALRQKT